MSDASPDFLKVHGLMADDGTAGVIFKSYLDILTDKIHDGFSANPAFEKLRSVTSDSVHVT